MQNELSSDLPTLSARVEQDELKRSHSSCSNSLFSRMISSEKPATFRDHARDAAPTFSALQGKQGGLDVRTTPSGYRVYTKLMPAPLSILRTDRGLDDKQPVSLVYVSILR
jgi:hypothetical protein